MVAVKRRMRMDNSKQPAPPPQALYDPWYFVKIGLVVLGLAGHRQHRSFTTAWANITASTGI